MPSSRSRFPWKAALVLVALALVVWRGVLSLSLYGQDTFPLIAASRIASWDDFVGTFREELMDGRFPGGHYYRPLVHLSFALDHALWGLEPFGYHLTDFVLLVAGALGVAWLAAELVGEHKGAWVLLAGLVYLLHPIHFELVPQPPRRSDSLSLVFTLFALAFAARARGRTSYVAGLLALGSVASKETGAMAPCLIALLGFAFGSEIGWGERFKGALRASWPALVLVALVLAWRWHVLGGMGGTPKASLEVGSEDVSKALGRYAGLVLAPRPPGWWPGAGFALAIGAAVFAYLALGLARSRTPRAGEGLALEPRFAALFVLAWCAGLIVLVAVAGRYRAWYALQFVAPLALLVALAASTMRAPRGGGTLRTLFAVLALVVLQGWFASSEQRWLEIRATSDGAREVLAHFDEVVESLPLGSVAEIDVAPSGASATRHGATTRKPTLFKDYSLSAWCELVHAARSVRIEMKSPRGHRPPRTDELLVLLLPREQGVDED